MASVTVDGIFGRGGNKLSLQQRHGQPYNRSDICNQYLHHHANRRGQRNDLPLLAITLNSGASQTFTITPASGYQVASVTVDGSSAGAATTYPFNNVAANHTISATFVLNTYTITPTAGANGTISPSSAVTLNSGASQTFTITRPQATMWRASRWTDLRPGRQLPILSATSRPTIQSQRHLP